jgi:hypothetical protein
MMFLGLALLAGSALAQTITPTAGQSAEQTAADQAACASQATAASGYNPSAPPPAAQTGTPVHGERLAGAARGAALGAVREGRTTSSEREVDDLTETAARAGAVAGGARQREARRDERRQTQAAEATHSQQQPAYAQAFASCMTAKGYTVQ